MLVGAVQPGWPQARPEGRAGHPSAIDPHRAAPGSVPYADYLRATNETDRAADRRPPAREPDRFEPSACARGRIPAPKPTEPPARSGGWATLGEVAPVGPATRDVTVVSRITRAMSPLGAMIDLTV